MPGIAGVGPTRRRRECAVLTVTKNPAQFSNNSSARKPLGSGSCMTPRVFLAWVVELDGIGGKNGWRDSNRHIRKKFVTRDEQNVAGYAEAMTTVFAHWEYMPLTENHIKQLPRDLLQYSSKDERHPLGMARAWVLCFKRRRHSIRPDVIAARYGGGIIY